MKEEIQPQELQNVTGVSFTNDATGETIDLSPAPMDYTGEVVTMHFNSDGTVGFSFGQDGA